jgi:hypothetical protein
MKKESKEEAALETRALIAEGNAEFLRTQMGHVSNLLTNAEKQLDTAKDYLTTVKYIIRGAALHGAQPADFIRMERVLVKLMSSMDPK